MSNTLAGFLGADFFFLNFFISSGSTYFGDSGGSFFRWTTPFPAFIVKEISDLLFVGGFSFFITVLGNHLKRLRKGKLYTGKRRCVDGIQGMGKHCNKPSKRVIAKGA